ncbi:uncharacterized protein LOC130726814 [Lotus japonicus]|uniref:uncharacterized protein LOC130726814 n=1 Tax=Lotus japonicus TaxID=34305 RepID=UPI0025905378|nr:uncharacterized protein LOC130726814 [Lotus japonicus]
MESDRGREIERVRRRRQPSAFAAVVGFRGRSALTSMKAMDPRGSWVLPIAEWMFKYGGNDDGFLTLLFQVLCSNYLTAARCFRSKEVFSDKEIDGQNKEILGFK